MTKLSIIIPVYNVQEYVEKCVLSVAQQNIPHEDYEIILINDGSTDKSLEVINIISKKYSNITIHTQKNTGLGGARNTGLELSKGEYVWFIDSDDYMQNDMLSEIMDIIKTKTIDVIAMDYNIVNVKGDILSSDGYLNDSKNNIITGADFYFKNYTKSYTCMFVFKRDLFINNGLRFKERINMQDSEIFPKLMYFTNNMCLLNKAIYNYVQHDNSFTNSSNPEVRYKYFESIITVKKSLADFSEQINDNNLLKNGIELKQKGIDRTIFDHLVFFKYEKKWLVKIISFLTENDAYPIKYKARGKLKLVKYGLNINPFLSKKLIDFFR